MILIGSVLALLTLGIGIAILFGTILNGRRARATVRAYEAVKLRHAADVKRRPAR